MRDHQGLRRVDEGDGSASARRAPEDGGAKANEHRPYDVTEMDAMAAREGQDDHVPAVWVEPDSDGPNDNRAHSHHPGQGTKTIGPLETDCCTPRGPRRAPQAHARDHRDRH
jgi:hypothetical protein